MRFVERFAAWLKRRKSFLVEDGGGALAFLALIRLGPLVDSAEIGLPIGSAGNLEFRVGFISSGEQTRGQRYPGDRGDRHKL